MTALEQALSRYEEGRLTATGLILESLQLVNAQNVDAVVGSLPFMTRTLHGKIHGKTIELDFEKSVKPLDLPVGSARLETRAEYEMPVPCLSRRKRGSYSPAA
jgi:hypothetical protein